MAGGSAASTSNFVSDRFRLRRPSIRCYLHESHWQAMISINVRRKIITLSQHEQGLATAAHTRAAMAPAFQAAINLQTTESPFSLTISESTLARMVVKYSEQLVFQPLEEIRYWFTYSSGAFLEPGY